jgi:hypothetical protein
MMNRICSMDLVFGTAINSSYVHRAILCILKFKAPVYTYFSSTKFDKYVLEDK